MLSKIINLLTHRQNVYLDSLSGMGLANFTRKITTSLHQLPNTIVLDIYPHDSTFQKPQFIESLLLSKFAVEHPYPEVKNFNQLQNTLSTKSIKLIIVLHKIQQYQNILDYLDCLKSLYESSSITILITATVFSLPFHDLILSCQKLTFPGYVKEFDKIISELQTSLNYQLTSSQSDTIYRLCLGHTALIKTLIQLFSDPDFNFDEKTIIGHPAIVARLDNLFRSIQFVQPNLDLIFSDQPQLIRFGLHNGQTLGYLYDKYYQNQKKQTNITDSFTPTEKSIFQYLLTRGQEYSTVEQILDTVYPSEFIDKSDWSVYKHLNNLRHKISGGQYQLDSRRSRGYRLAIRPSSVDID